MKKMTKDRFKELRSYRAHLYVARVYNEEESFYKIGITSKESAYNRLRSLPYNFRILKEVFHPNPVFIFNLRKHLISLETKYIPKIPFDGQTKSVDAVLDYLSTLIWVEGIKY